MKVFQRRIAYHVLPIFFLLVTFFTPPVYAQFGADPAGLTQIEGVFRHVVQISVAGAFIALAVILVIAGIKFLTSGGEPKAIESARNTVTWALLGILFMAIAWLVLQLIAAFTGIQALPVFKIGELCIPPGNLAKCTP